MEFVLLLAFAIVVGVIYLLVQFWWVFLILLLLAVLAGMLYFWASRRMLNRLKEEVIRAELINSEPIVERIAEKTGYSIGYGRYLSSREYFRYRDVVTGHKVKFACYYRNGEHNVRTCKKGSQEYNILISKTAAINFDNVGNE
jgi:Zn-dependent protease with chaperone function